MNAPPSCAPVVLFDLDGTLVDSLASIVRCWSETLPEFGLAVPDVPAIRAQVGPPVHQGARAFAPDADDATLDAIVAAYRARSVAARDVSPFPGIPRLLAELTAGDWRIGVATSKSIEVVEPLLEHLGWTDTFAVVEGSRRDELGAAKTTVIGRALAQLHPTTPVAMVGDRHHDIEGAHAHDLWAIGVLWGYGDAAELTRAGAAEIVSSTEALGDRLAARRGASFP